MRAHLAPLGTHGLHNGGADPPQRGKQAPCVAKINAYCPSCPINLQWPTRVIELYSSTFYSFFKLIASLTKSHFLTLKKPQFDS